VRFLSVCSCTLREIERIKTERSDAALKSKSSVVKSNNQSRYWTDEEHQRFLDAVREYGPRDSKKIAAYVGTRDVTQVRSHAQKYFIKISQQST